MSRGSDVVRVPTFVWVFRQSARLLVPLLVADVVVGTVAAGFADVVFGWSFNVARVLFATAAICLFNVAVRWLVERKK